MLDHNVSSVLVGVCTLVFGTCTLIMGIAVVPAVEGSWLGELRVEAHHGRRCEDGQPSGS